MQKPLLITIACLTITCALPSDALAQPAGHRAGGHISLSTSNPQPWLLDLDTRLQRRFDPNLRSARLKAAGRSPTSDADIIQGEKNPELFLPWEVHRFLLSTAFYADASVAAAWRARFASAVPELRIPQGFWATLAKVSADYLDGQRQIASLSDDMRKADSVRREQQRQAIVLKESSQCGLRLLALERANDAFGREWFDEFLYRAVAPNLTISTSTPTSAERLRFVAGGCK